MDLSINLENSVLYIRVALLIKSQNGYIFEKSPLGHVFPVGGKIKLNETSIEAAKREMMEELGFEVKNLKFKSVLENFYSKDDINFHELCFVYETGDVFLEEVGEGFVEISESNIDSLDIRPKIMIDFILGKDNEFSKILNK
jgi:8-oxo-dGTP pyrophosphatase MutT (NUDIX family)